MVCLRATPDPCSDRKSGKGFRCRTGLCDGLCRCRASRIGFSAHHHALLRHNIVFRYVLAFIAIGSALILTSPAVQRILGFSSLGWIELGLVAATGSALLLLFELTKARPFRTHG
ncbi:MAG: cation transporting ATPase C-terminal domain-containing protein [Sphingobium sp.]